MEDRLQRGLKDLRISVTDRCNFRCVYCMPREVFGPTHAFLPHAELLTFEEVSRLARIFVGAGVRKLRVTGGEPLVRRDIEVLIAQLAGIPGVDDLALTTNGSLLPRKAEALAAAGLRRVTVSLDALDEAVFQSMNAVRFPVARVLEGIAAAEAAGLTPIKINTVVKRGANEHAVLPLAEHFRGSGHILRFIEYMDVGNSNGWRLEDTVSAAEIRRRVHARWPLEPLTPNYAGEVASRYRYRDGGGEIGFVASVSQPFCRGCTRARLSAEGRLYTCLFSATGHDLKGLLRGGASDGEIAEFLTDVWGRRGDRYSDRRSRHTAGLPKVEMSHIGG